MQPATFNFLFKLAFASMCQVAVNAAAQAPQHADTERLALGNELRQSCVLPALPAGAGNADGMVTDTAAYDFFEPPADPQPPAAHVMQSACDGVWAMDAALAPSEDAITGAAGIEWEQGVTASQDETAFAQRAEVAPPDTDGFGAGLKVVSAEALDGMRGGYQTPQGTVSFGFERAVYVNGQLFATQTLNLENLANVSAHANLGALVVQNGTGNVFAAADIANGALPMVIQNTLDNQTIRTVTTINATVPAMSALQNITQMRTVSQAIADAATLR